MLAQLKVLLGMDISQMKSGLNEAEVRTGRTSKKIEHDFSRMRQAGASALGIKSATFAGQLQAQAVGVTGAGSGPIGGFVPGFTPSGFGKMRFDMQKLDDAAAKAGNEEGHGGEFAVPRRLGGVMEWHEIANMIPMMTAEEFTSLADNIQEEGLDEDIVTFEGKVLDGRNREKACLQRGVVPRCKPFKGDRLAAILFVNRRNLKRRNLSNVQLGTVAREMSKQIELERRLQPDKKFFYGNQFTHSKVRSGGVQISPRPEKSRDIARMAVGVAAEPVKVATRADINHPEIYKKMQSGEIETVSEAKRQMEHAEKRPGEEYKPPTRRATQLVNAFRGRVEHCSGSLEASCRFFAGVDAEKVLGCMNMERANELLSEVLERSKELDDAAKHLGETFSQSFQRMIEGGMGIHEMLQGLLKQIELFAIKALVLKEIGSALSGSSGWLGAIGSLFGGLSAPGRASGGPVAAGNLYTVGEHGPEYFVPRVSGQIVPTATSMSKSSTLVFAPKMFINTPDADSFKKSSSQIMGNAYRQMAAMHARNG